MDLGALSLLGLLVVLVVLVLGMWQLHTASARGAELRERADVLPSEGAGARFGRRLDQLIRGSARARRLLVDPLEAAGLDLPPYQLALLAAAGALGSFQVAVLFGPVWFGLLVAATFLRVLWAWIEYKRRKRLELFVSQLPELAQLLSNGASAGLSIVAAMERARDELSEPARSEVRAVLERMRVGQSLDLALERLRERMPSRDLAVLVGTLVIQQRSGGDVVDALANMSEALEQRKGLRGEVRTLMSGVVFTAYAVVGLAVATVFLLNAIAPGALDRMLASPLGIAVVVFAAITYTIALTLVRNVTRIEV